MEGSLSWDLRKCPDELRERATRMALEALADPARAKGAIRRIGEELGVHPEALRTWVKKAQVDGGLRPGTTTDEAQRIKELEKEIRELRRANAILKSASACLSRRSVSARPADLPVHRDQEGGVRGLADLQGAHWLWVADIPPQAGGAPSYVRTFSGWVYVAFVTDVYSRRIGPVQFSV